MGKRTRRSPSPAGPLGSRRVRPNAAAVAAGPSAEEEALAASLFGAASSSSRVRGAASGAGGTKRIRAERDERETGREGAQDEDLFMLDTAVDGSDDEGAGFTIDATAFDSADEEEEEKDVDEIRIGDSQDEGSEDYDDDSSASEDDEATSISSLDEGSTAGPDALPSLPASASKARKPAWVDPSLSTLLVPLAGAAARAVDGSLLGTRRLRKLREYEGETEVGGVEYERRLRKMYESLHPRPAWASSQAAAAAGSTGALSVLLSKSGALVRSSKSGKARIGRLASGSLEVQRARDGNQAIDKDEAAAAVECLAWHPSSRVRLLMTASRDRKLRLFEIDGTSNPLLQTLHVPSLPLTHASFHPSGSSVLLAGPRPYLYSYDLQSGRTTRSTPWRGSSNTGYDAERDLSMARFQSTGGRLLAIGGRRGAVHLLDWGSGAGATGAAGAGAGASIVGSLRLNAALVGMAWDPTRLERLLTLSAEGAVHVWDTRMLSCEISRRDAGLFGGVGLEPSPSAEWWAVGSQGGTVNVYDGNVANAQEGEKEQGTMSAKKEIGNLTTRITTMRWNHDGQILALASRNKKDALKLVHAPSLSVFANWPTSGTPLGHVTDVAFSGASEYAAIANSRGRVLLYSLRHYTS